MGFISSIANEKRIKYSFGKNNTFARIFNSQTKSLSMDMEQFGLNIPKNLSPEHQLRAVFREVIKADGIFLFNICGVDLLASKKGFESYDEASDNNMITEWELSLILQNEDYYERTIFHNGKVKLKISYK